MRSNNWFISIFLGNLLDLPKSTIFVQCRTCRRVTKGVDTLVHAQCQVGILYRHCVPFAVFIAKEKSAIFLRNEDKGWCPFHLDGFNNAQGGDWIHLLFLEFFRHWTWTVLGWVYWSSICHFKFGSVLLRVIQPKCPSHILSNDVSMLINLLQQAQSSSGKIGSSPQSVFEIFADSKMMLSRSFWSLRRSNGLRESEIINRLELNLTPCVGVWPSPLNIS